MKEGSELEKLRKELIAKLTGLADDETGETAILEVIDTQCSFRGPYLDDAPDLLVDTTTAIATHGLVPQAG